MVRSVLLVFFSALAFTSFANEWYKGSLTLRSESVLQGQISIQEGYDVALLKVDDEITVIPAFKIAFMDLYDEKTESDRRFVTLYLGVGAARTFRFFEIMVDGEVSLLRKEVNVWYSLHFDMTEYEYYVLYGDELIDASKFKRTVYPDLVKKSDGALKSYVRENKLIAYKLSDVVSMLEFYNQYKIDHVEIARHQD